MKDRGITIFVMVVGLLTLSVPMFAHHQGAEFDTTKQVTIKGTVTEWFWANPHCFLRLDVKDDNGEIVHWAVETQAPPNIVPSGWTKESFKPGDEVSVTLAPARNGKPLGSMRRAVLANGKVLGFGAAANAVPARANSN